MKRINYGTLVATMMVAALFAGCGKNEPEKQDPPAGAQPAPLSSMPPAMGDQMVDLNWKPPVETPVVDVDGRALRRSQLDNMVMQMMAQRRVPPQAAQSARPQFERIAINNFILHALLLGEAERRKVAVSDEEVQSRLDQLAKQLPPGVTVEQKLQQAGITMAQVKDDIRADLKVVAFRKELGKDVKPATEPEARALYDRDPSRFKDGRDALRARHILIKTEASDDAAAKEAKRKQLEGIKKQLAEGADFAALAAAHSACPSGKRAGGDLGKFTKGQMAPPFEKACYAQDLNVVGPIVETSFGYHLIDVLERELGKVQPFEAVSKQLLAQLTFEKQSQVVMSFANSLRPGATIKINGQAVPTPGAIPQPPAPEPPVATKGPIVIPAPKATSVVSQPVQVQPTPRAAPQPPAPSPPVAATGPAVMPVPKAVSQPVEVKPVPVPEATAPAPKDVP